MNAPNSITQDKRVSERKAYEPSMEEILASIRRIIADDQALATRRAAVPKEKPQPVDPPAALAGVNIPPLASSPKPATNSGNGSGFMLDTQRAGAEPKLQSAFSSAPAAERVAPSSEKVAPQRNENPVPKSAPEAEIHEFASPPCNMAEAMADDLRRGHDDDFEEPELNKEPENEAMAVSEAQRLVTKASTQRGAGTAADALVSPSTDTSVSAAFNTLVASRFLQSSDALSDVIREMIRPMLKTWLDENLPGMVERLVRAEIERVTRGGR